jgi:hypothetical protein
LADLCKELAGSIQTLYLYVSATGELQPDGKNLIAREHCAVWLFVGLARFMSLGDILGILGLLVGVASNVVTYYLYVRTFASKAISTYIHTTMPVSHPELMTLSSGGLAPLGYSDCTVWNSGRTTIYGNDLKSENGIEISLPEGAEIFKGPLIQVSLRENKVEVYKHSPAGFSCRFEYLDPGQGFLVSIGYAAPTQNIEQPTLEPPKITGVVAGMPQGITSLTRRVQMIRYFYESYGSLGAILLIFLLVQIFSTLQFSYALIVDTAIIAMVIFGAMGLYRAMRSRRPLLLIPQY